MRKITVFFTFMLLWLISPQFANSQVRLLKTGFHKEPYLIFSDNNTKMTVLWQLYKADPSVIQWGLDTTYSLGSDTCLEYTKDHLFKYVITGLKPNTKYYYRVIADSHRASGSFVTGKPSDVKQLTFYAYGDTRSHPWDHDKVAEAIIRDYTSEPQTQTFIIMSGDLVFNGNKEKCWDKEFFAPQYRHIRQMMANLPYMAAMGNHEGSGRLFAKYFPYEFYNDTTGYYYSFDQGPAHFVILDQFTDYSPGSEQYKWLVNDLSSTDRPWKFIVLHKPGWTAGGHRNNKDVQKYIQPLAEKYGVQFVIAGHNHYYARAAVNGVQHITTGGGGAPLYDVDTTKPNIVKAEKTLNFCKFTINGDTLVYKAFRPDGSLIDSLTIRLK